MKSGLPNIGNTCYINAILQGLLSTEHFVKYILSSDFTTDLSVKNISFDLEDEANRQKVIRTIIYNISKIIKLQLTDEEGVLGNNLHNLRVLFGKYTGGGFIDFRQHDSQEFLNFLIDKIHEELKTDITVNFDNLPQNIISYIDNIKNMDKTSVISYTQEHLEEDSVYKYMLFWKEFLKTNNSIITRLFGGTYITGVQCTECGNSNISFEYTNNLLLPINDENATLDELLTNFTKIEKLDGDNMYACEICNKKTIANKRLMIWEPPRNLIILLKKYSNKLFKTANTITYPQELSICNYISNIRKKYWHTSAMYNLYSVTKHSGSLGGGHYYSYSKNFADDSWYKYDDDSVVPSNIEDALSCNGYLLWYKLV